MLKKFTLLTCISFTILYAHAKTLRDSTTKKDSVLVLDPPKKDSIIMPQSPVKTLTYTQYDALLKGEDLYNMSLVAELNHFPMPDKVLKFKKELDLSPTQVSKLVAINTELHRKRVEMGGIIIRNERMLDSLFKTRQVYDGSIIFYTNRYGLYQGELRNAILQACFATEKLLSPGQIKNFEAFEDHNK